MRGTLIALAVAGALVMAGCGSDGESSASDEENAPVEVTGLDTDFGTKGVRSVPLSATDPNRLMAVTTAPDGKIYATGYVSKAGDHQMAIVRLNADGTLNKSFGTDGVTLVNVAVGGKTAEIARSIVVQPDGKIVVAGPYEHAPTATGDAAKDLDIALVRVETSGKLDSGFGTGGIAKIDLGPGKTVSASTYVADTSWGLGVLPGNKLVVFGSTVATGADRTDADYVLVGVTNSGTIDSTFGTNGTTKVDIKSSGDNPRTVTVQSDGKIIATGYSRDGDGVVSPVLIRTSATGVLDTSFGANGVATAKVLPNVAESYALGVQNGSYVLVGYGSSASTERADLISMRFTSAGVWDQTYGTAGVTRVDIAKEDDRGRNMIVLPDGRVLAIGSGKATATNVDAMVVLLDAKGVPVSSFGTNGALRSDLGGPADAWYGVTLTKDKDAVLVVGYQGADATGGSDVAAVARLAI